MIKRIAPVAALLPLLLATTAGVATAQHSTPKAAEAVTLTYDASGAGDWADAITKSAENWNSHVQNVHLEPASSPGDADFVYEATSGWPQSTLGPIMPGSRGGEVQLGQEAVNEGYDLVRITTHETGHILGLPDDYEGPCSEVMSGHGPGPSCTNATPDANESAEVDANYANGIKALHAKGQPVVVDLWHATAAH